MICVRSLLSVEDSKFIFRSLQIDCFSGVRVRDKCQLTGRLDHILSQNLLELFLAHEFFKLCESNQAFLINIQIACGDSYLDTYVDALGHPWDNGKVTKEPTETETGVKTFTCTRCGET